MKSPTFLLIIVALSIFISEALIMLLLSLLPPQSNLVESLVDATLLVCLVYPSLYYFLFRPMREHITETLVAKLQADYANEQKSLFLANMSHELRTPMHAILSYSELGMDKIETAERSKLSSYFERVNTSGQRLLNLVNNLLDLSKLEAGKMQINPSLQDIRSLISEVLMEFGQLISAKNLEVKLLPTEFDPATEFDPILMGQVLRNLLSNAVKFTPQGGSISLLLSQSNIVSGRRVNDTDNEPAIALQIRDSGIGIPQHELTTIFDKFVQSSLTKNGSGGTGLGLAICKEITDAHRGSLIARNNPEGGATFVLTLPLRQHAADNLET
jgi:signal transduction histidine kinase